MMLIYYYSVVLVLAVSLLCAAAESSVRGSSGNKLFEFAGDCTDDDYADTPYYVSSSIGNNWNMANGWGLSPDKPFKSIQFAVNNKAKCQTIYVMEGTYRNNNYGQSKNNNAKIVSLNNVSNLKILADPNASKMPLLQFDGAGGIFGGSASSPINNIEIQGLRLKGPMPISHMRWQWLTGKSAFVLFCCVNSCAHVILLSFVIINCDNAHLPD